MSVSALVASAAFGPLFATHAVPEPSTLRTTQDRAADAAMNRYADGDDAAFGTLYELLAPRLLGSLLRSTRGDRARAEDLVQQTFLQMHCARSDFRAGASVLPWAFAIARRLSIDSFRRRGREPLVDLDLDLFLDGGPRADDAVLSGEIASQVERAIATMPATQTAALELVRGDGLSFVEAGEVLGLSAGAVKVRVHRALQHVRGMVGALLDEPLSQRAPGVAK